MTMMMMIPSRRQCSRRPFWRKLFILACTICILHCGLIISSVSAQEEDEVEALISALHQQADADNDNNVEQPQPPLRKEKPEEEDDQLQLDEEKQEASPSSSSLIVEKDYLDHLSTAALEKICLDRGFAVAPPQQDDANGTVAAPLTREDYLEAARRCLTLEDEINLILAEHPELAAELESEVERMRQQKERLEVERNELQAELKLLQSQLENAGFDINNIASFTKEKDKTTDLKDIDPRNMTLEQVLRYTLTELVERVKGDMKFVWSLIRPIVAPMIPTVQKLYKSYGQPLAKQIWKMMRKVVRMVVQEYKKRTTAENDSTSAAGPLSVAASPAR